MKKLLAILLVLCTVFALAACGDKADDPTTSNSPTPSGDDSVQTPSGEQQPEEAPDEQPVVSARDTLNLAMTQDRGTLDPAFMMGYDLMNAMRMVYEPLWDVDLDGNRIYLLATDLTMVEPTVWHVKLREGVTFANGNPFNANDVLFSLQRANNRTGEPQSFPVLNLEKTKALDEYTVEMVFDSYDMAYVYTFSLAYMYDEETCGGDILAATLATTPNGTGPYEVTDYLINSHLDLTARESGYWGQTPAIKNLHCAIMTEDAQIITSLETGMVDIAVVPYADIEYVQTIDDLTVNVASGAQAPTKALYFNPSDHSVFYENPDARKAVAMAIDRQAIANIAYSGFASVSRLPVSVYNTDVEERFMDIGVYGTGYDPEGAKALAESSGLVGKEILIIDNGSSDSQVVAELIQANLAEIGITANVQNLDPGSWLSVVFDDTQYDMAVDMTVAPSMTLAQHYYSWINFHVGGSYTRNPWPGKDRALELANSVMSMSDPQQLSDTYMELTQLQTDAMLWFNLVDQLRAVAYNSDIIGYNSMISGGIDYSKLAWAA
jgi:peptide/nickel transport system substrate-binding protein